MIIVVLVVFRLLVAYHLHSTFFSTGDQSYDDIAEQLVHGHGFTMNGHPYVANPPVYPLLVAASFEVLGHHWYAIAVLQTLADCVSVLLLFALGQRLMGFAAGLLAAAAFAVYPYLASQSAQLMDTSVFVCSLLAFLYFSLRAAQERSTRWGAAAGVAAGVGFLIRPTIAIVALLFPLLAALVGADRRAIARLTAAAAVAGIVAIAPWTVRNAVDFHTFVPGAAKAGINFWKGNSPYAAEYIAEGKSVDLLPERPGAPHAPRGLNAVQEDAWWRDRAFAWIRAHPGAWAHGLEIKLIAFWSWDLNPRTGGDAGTKQVFYTATYGPLLLLGLIGAAVGWGMRRRSVLVIMSVVVAFTAVNVLTVGYTRLRAPLDPLLMLLAAGLVVDLAGLRVRARRMETT